MVIAAVGLGSVGYVWVCALTGRRDGVLGAALAALTVEGIAVLAGRGDCPLGPLQQRLGDPAPLFELVLPPRAARAAFPVLVAVTVGGVIALWSNSGAMAWRTLRSNLLMSGAGRAMGA